MWPEFFHKESPMPVKPIPDPYHSITPFLYLQGAAAAIDFYQRAFGATELMRMPGPDGKVMHAEIMIGDSPIMLADESPEMGIRGPQALGGTSIGILLYVPDVDAVFQRAVSAGAKEVRPLVNQFYGDRSGTVEDPFGHQWTIATHVEDVSPEEMERRFAAMMSGQPS